GNGAAARRARLRLEPDAGHVAVRGLRPERPPSPYFTTGPVPEFLVEDFAAATQELRDSGVELLGEPVVEADGGWVHFRAPDGNVYGLTAAATYRRPTR